MELCFGLLGLFQPSWQQERQVYHQGKVVSS